jgi:hypothetical protein
MIKYPVVDYFIHTTTTAWVLAWAVIFIKYGVCHVKRLSKAPKICTNWNRTNWEHFLWLPPQTQKVFPVCAVSISADFRSLGQSLDMTDAIFYENDGPCQHPCSGCCMYEVINYRILYHKNQSLQISVSASVSFWPPFRILTWTTTLLNSVISKFKLMIVPKLHVLIPGVVSSTF